MPNYDDILNKIDEANSRKFNAWTRGDTPHSAHEKPSFDSYVRNKVVADYTYSKPEIDNKIAGAGPGPGPGPGPKSNILLPTNNTSTQTLLGAYGCNIIDYRTLSRQPEFFTHGHTLVNKGKRKMPSNKVNMAGGSLGFTGIKADRTFTYDYNFYGRPEGISDPGHNTGELKLQLSSLQHDKQTGKEIKIAGGTVGSTKETSIDYYGNYNIDIGSNDSNEAHYECTFQAWYGNVRPVNKMDRSFVFKEINGYPMRANCDTYGGVSGGVWKKADEYKPGNMYDEYIQKLGHVRLKDCKLYRPAKEHTQVDKELFLCVEIPSDGYVAERPEQDTEDQTAGMMVLTNNLSEILREHEQVVVQEHPNVPFFVKDSVKMPVFVKQKDGSVKTETKWCWIIIASPEVAYKWQDLLSKTEIIYPLKTEKRIKVPNSGFIVTLTDGSYIESWKYTQIQDNGDGCYVFGASTLGYQPIKIQKSQIVSVSPKVP